MEDKMNFLLEQELYDLPDNYHSMEIFGCKNDVWIISCIYELDASFNDEKIQDSIVLQIEIPGSFPEIPPRIKEIGNRLSCFPHINPDGYFCLGTPEAIGKILKQSPNLACFLDKALVPYLYCAFYYLKHKKEPFPCASHGLLGRIEEYCIIFDVNDPVIAKQFLDCVEYGSDPYCFCPCRSGKKLKDCHWQKIKEVRKIVHPDK